VSLGTFRLAIEKILSSKNELFPWKATQILVGASSSALVAPSYHEAILVIKKKTQLASWPGLAP
jgi:hypothetical protein